MCSVIESVLGESTLFFSSDGTCDNIKWEVLGITQGPITVEPTISEAAGRTGDFLYAYLVLSCAWIVSSMSLIGE